MRFLFLFLLFFVNVYAANGNVDLNTLYTHGNVTVGSSSIKIGDLIIAFVTGFMAYLLLVGTFLFSFVSVGKAYYGNDNGSRDVLDSTNLAKVFFKPIIFLIFGLIFFNVITLFLKWYNIDIYQELKFFFEARYDTLINSLDISHRLMPFGQNILIALDLFSKFAFWSLIFVYLLIYLIVFSIIAVILVTFIQNDNDQSIIKKVFYALLVFVIGMISTGIFSSFCNNILFKDHPNIQNIGVVTDINAANKKSFKHIVNLGMGGIQ